MTLCHHLLALRPTPQALRSNTTHCLQLQLELTATERCTADVTSERGEVSCVRTCGGWVCVRAQCSGCSRVCVVAQAAMLTCANATPPPITLKTYAATPEELTANANCPDQDAGAEVCVRPRGMRPRAVRTRYVRTRDVRPRDVRPRDQRCEAQE
ncbi:hypothetical protein WMY93_018087 [Mugilogobius chulae]|uniref:Uncharacterized protein n=1 Tax=Mugilogobius chulae TaxID=88201 RepID=A0AAW0NJ49_9GOBI